MDGMTRRRSLQVPPVGLLASLALLLLLLDESLN